MAKEIYSLDEDKMVPVEEETPAKPEEESEESETEQEEESEEDPKNKDTSSEEESEDEPSDEEQPSEPDEEPKDEEPETSEEEPAEEEGEAPTVDEVIKNVFSEKYGIETEDDFIQVLDESTKLLDENEALHKEIEELKKAPKEPVFKSESQKAVFEILKDYDPERIPDGMNMIAALVSMDVSKTDPKMILEQRFIMEHPELSIDRARRKFQRDFDAKYTVKDEDYEDPAELQEKKKDIEEDIEIEAAQARKFLKEKQKEIKIKSEDKPEEKPQVNERVQNSIAKNVAAFEEHFTGIEKLSFQVDENDKKNLFHYTFSKEELGKIKKVMDDHLKHPAAYDDKGNLIGGFDPEEKFQTAAFAVSGVKITEKALQFARKYAQVIKAEEIAKKHPERKPKAAGKSESMSFDAQAERLAKKKQAERQASRR